MATIHGIHELAAKLRALADQFQSAPDAAIPATGLDVSLQVLSHDGTAPDTDRVAAVNRIAAILGTSPHTDDDAPLLHRSGPYGSPRTVLAFTAIRGDNADQ